MNISNQEENQTLGYLGDDFQYKLAKYLIENSAYYNSIKNTLNPNAFTVPVVKTIISTMNEYAQQYNSVADYTTLKMLLNSKFTKQQDKERINAEIDKIKNDVSIVNDKEWVRQQSSNFFKQQELVKAINQAREIIANGEFDNYDRIKNLIETALNKVHASEDMGRRPFEDIEGTMKGNQRKTIPTGIRMIDERTNGGIGKGELGLICGPSGFGKVQPYDAMVCTPSGMVPMREIVVGSEVIGADGKPHRVLAVFPHKDWDFYKVTFSDGVSTECGMEHLWCVNTIQQRTKRNHVKGNHAKRVSARDDSYITMSLEDIVKHGLKTNSGARKFKIPMANTVEYKNSDLPIEPYVLGMFIGDGYFLRKSITISNEDLEAFKEILKDSKHDFVIHSHEYPANNRKLIHEFYYHQSFGNLLKELYGSEFESIKSADKYIPEAYMYHANRLELLQGLLDTDGTCQKNGCICYNTKSQKLAQQVQQLVFSLGGYAKIRHKQASYKKNGENVDCGIHYEVTISMYERMQMFRLQRKQERVSYREKYKNNRFFESVEFSRKADGQCILVESDDHTYLTDNYIVTHNTTTACALASYAGSCRKPDGSSGYKVLYIFFEDTYVQIMRKFMARELNIEACMLNRYYESVGRSREDMASLDRRFRAINENVYLHKLRDGEKSASEIEDMIRHNYIERGFQPDLVIIDYFECVGPEKGTMQMGQHERELFTMRRIEAMCESLNCAIWVTTQGTKDSASAELITADKISGSASKVNVSHICMAIMKTQEDKQNNTASIVFLKNRAGATGAVMTGVHFDNGTCRISTEGATVMGFEEFQEKEEQRQINMRAYIGQLQFTAKDVKIDIPKTGGTSSEFFGGENDNKLPFG